MDLQLDGKIAVVTGASLGIGRGIARMLAGEGCRLALVARRQALLDAVADEIAKEGRERPLVVARDITRDGAADRIRDAVYERFGAADILVNNAGGSRPQEDLGDDTVWAEGMMLNFEAGRRLTHAFLPRMRERRFGRIVNITGSDEPLGINTANPPNGAVHVWAKGLSRVIAADGVTINSIPPGRIHSEQIDQRILPTEEAAQAWVKEHCPVGYIGEPEDLALLAVFLCSPRARYITGQVIHVDGGVRRFSH